MAEYSVQYYLNGGDKEYHSFNVHGDTAALFDAAGTITKNYDYNAFGNQTTAQENDNNPFRYCGEYFDNETNFIYLRARYYNSEIGRFTTEEPAKDGVNWYIYCENNPIRYIDPSGLIITCTEADSTTIISLLGELSGNSLELEYKDGQIQIIKTYDTKNHVGQTLVIDLINSSDTVNINIGIVDPQGNINTKWPANSDPNGIIQIYIDPEDKLGNGALYTYVQQPDGTIVEEEFPQFILLGHELIHAWREIRGLFDYNVEQGQIPYDKGLTWPAEELKTMGINYTDTSGNSMQEYDTCNGIISENGLRLENQLNIRVSYLGWWK